MATNLKNLSDYDTSKVPDAEKMKFGIVVSEWNPSICEALLKGANGVLTQAKIPKSDSHYKMMYY